MNSVSVAVLGVGRIGLPVTAALARAGQDVRAFDVRTDVAGDVRAAGARWSQGLDEALTGAAVVLTVLPGSPELEALALAPDGLLHRLSGDCVWVDLTSAAPDLGTRLQHAADQRHLAYLDAPVGGGPDAARDGALTLYVGGEPDVLARVRPVLDAIAARVLHVGAQGAGYLTKLLVNLLWFDQAVAVGEALVLAGRAGLDLETLAGVLPSSPAASAFIRDYLPRALAGDVVPDFGIDRVVEELDSLTRLAESLDVPFAVGTAAAEVHRAALRRYGARAGELLAIAHLAEEVGVDLTG